jgi:phosphoserine aminotransferase
MANDMPGLKPANPRFSCGPCTKRPGWSLDVLKDAPLGRSHRAKIGRDRLKLAIDLTREILEIPADYRIAIVPASDTGAVEMALWSLLGERGVDVLAWEAFSLDWVIDIVEQLRLSNVRVMNSDYGKLPDLSKVDCDRDIVFAWNGTTSGVRVPNGDWIKADRKGLTICDATSAAFAQDLDWPKLDVTTFSWQKIMGGEAAHGMLILSPRAVQRLQTYTPPWPLPKLFRMTKNGELMEALFEGETINTPSMLAVEDYIDALNWAKSIGGLDALQRRADDNCKVFSDWVAKTPWIDFLSVDSNTRSNTSMCLMIVDPQVTSRSAEVRAEFAKTIVSALEIEKVAYDISSYRDAPAGLRIWTGSTVETRDLEILTEWLDWAFVRAKAGLSKAA